MQKILNFTAALAIVFSANVVFALSQKGFVQIAPNRQLYADHIPAREGQPTLVLLNGLTYSTEDWNKLMPFLVNQGFGILKYDAMGQGRTLLKYGNNPKEVPIPIESQAKDLASLIRALGIQTKVSLVGLSYGGGLDVQFAAMYPKAVDKLILIAPFVAPLPNQDAYIQAQISATRLMFPYNPATNDELYDYFLHQYILTTFPSADPSIMKNPYLLESTYRMTVGIRKMDYRGLVNLLPNKSVHLLVALQDEYIPYSMLDQFWNAIPEEKRMSRINILSPPNMADPLKLTGYFHKMPESIPEYAGAWITQIMKKNPEINKGRVFYGNTFTGAAQCGNVILKLTK